MVHFVVAGSKGCQSNTSNNHDARVESIGHMEQCTVIHVYNLRKIAQF